MYLISHKQQIIMTDAEVAAPAPVEEAPAEETAPVEEGPTEEVPEEEES